MLHDDGRDQQLDEVWDQINELIEHVNAVSLAVEELQQLKTAEKPKRTYTRRTSSKSKKE